ncbi:uncharacterized protein [Diabrotica undecimpunctata]|uniref:uncharacterized protein n=1 Tax=Diabrotica undecimpunctata TaxID=50387 RepID=UPI003B63A309
MEGTSCKGNQRSDRIMSVQLNTANTNMSIICAYAPQVGCGVALIEKKFIGGDLNGHISGEGAGIEKVHGSLGMGIKNDEGNSVIDFAVAWDLAIINTFFMNSEDQYVFVQYRSQLKDGINCKVIRGESVTEG